VNYITYSKDTGVKISGHHTEELAERAARRLDKDLRKVGFKRIR